MPIKIGEVEALFRYPVKSMSGELLEVAELGWHGLRVKDNKAGVYGTITRRGRLAVGQPILFEPAAQHRANL